VAVIAVGLIAGVLRFMHLGYPESREVDEYYYSKSACIYLGYSNRVCDIRSSAERYWRTNENDTGAWVHPPLGKWAIALGELVEGVNSYGWRVSSAVAGTATVVIVAIIAQVLFTSPLWTFVAGLLLATEGLEFVQSRVAFLDIFVTFWIALGLLFVLLDRRWIERRTPEPADAADPVTTAETTPAPTEAIGSAAGTTSVLTKAPRESERKLPDPLWRPWRLAAGAALGAAAASKWSGLTGIMAAIAISIVWEVVRRKRFGIRHPIWKAVQVEGFGLVLAYLVLPALIYVCSYAGWFRHFGFDLGAWIRLQGRIASYHEHLQTIDPVTHEPVHPYLSQAWKWILIWRPVAYYIDVSVPGIRKVIYAIGNPAIFWGALLAIPWTILAWWRDRDWRAGYIVLSIACLYLPWFPISRPQFFWYATPITPFFVLVCVYALRDLSTLRISGSRSRPYLPFAIGFVVLSVGLFVFFWPVLTGGPLTDAAYRLRVWFPTWT
jgi:dolichyl-phosphate-mannose-protein mannosyltransferase